MSHDEPLPGDGSALRDLLSLPRFAGCQVLGGAAGLDHRVTDVQIHDLGAAPLNLNPATALFLPDSASATFEVALARLAQQGVVAVVTAGTPLLSTIWLADRLGLPLVKIAHDDLLATALEALWQLRRGTVANAYSYAVAAHRLSRAGDTPERVTAVLSELLDIPVTVVSGPVPLAGAALPDTLTPDSRAPAIVTLGEQTFITCPTPSTRAVTQSPLTLVAHEGPAPAPLRTRLVSDTLELAALRLGSWVAHAQLTHARDRASQSALLTQLLTTTDPGPATVEQAVAQGWQLDGFHTAVVASGSHTDSTSMLAAERALRQELGTQHPTISLIPFGEGWLWWLTNSTDVPAEQYRAYIRATRAVLAGVASFGITAGLSQPRFGLHGLRDSIGEAQQLCRLAGNGPQRRILEHANALSPRQVIASALSDEETLRRARLLIEPLTHTTGDHLLETLQAYLASECSTTSTATRLGVHRNTVLRRLERVEAALGVRLDSPDARLALRLACRAG